MERLPCGWSGVSAVDTHWEGNGQRCRVGVLELGVPAWLVTWYALVLRLAASAVVAVARVRAVSVVCFQLHGDFLLIVGAYASVVCLRRVLRLRIGGRRVLVHPSLPACNGLVSSH